MIGTHDVVVDLLVRRARALAAVALSAAGPAQRSTSASGVCRRTRVAQASGGTRCAR